MLGLKVRSLCKELLGAPDLHTYASNLKTELSKIKTGNHAKAELQYTVKIDNEFTNNERVEVWHNSSKKGKPDRLIMSAYSL